MDTATVKETFLVVELKSNISGLTFTLMLGGGSIWALYIIEKQMPSYFCIVYCKERRDIDITSFDYTIAISKLIYNGNIHIIHLAL